MNIELQVHQVFFNPPHPNENHSALFVCKEFKEGILYHAIDDEDAPADECALKYAETRISTIFRKPYLHDKSVFVGTMRRDKLDAFRKLCAKVGRVSRPHELLRPNCVTWVENLLYDLGQDGTIVRINRDFRLPAKRQIMVVSTSSKNPGASQGGASSSSSPKSRSKSSKSSKTGSASSSKK